MRINLNDRFVEDLQAIADYYETDVEGAANLLLGDMLYEASKYIEDGVYDPQ